MSDQLKEAYDRHQKKLKGEWEAIRGWVLSELKNLLPEGKSSLEDGRHFDGFLWKNQIFHFENPGYLGSYGTWKESTFKIRTEATGWLRYGTRGQVRFYVVTLNDGKKLSTIVQKARDLQQSYELRQERRKKGEVERRENERLLNEAFPEVPSCVKLERRTDGSYAFSYTRTLTEDQVRNLFQFILSNGMA